MSNFELVIKLFVDGYEVIGHEENVQLIMTDGQIFIGDIERVAYTHLEFRSNWFPQGVGIEYKYIAEIRLLNLLDQTEELER